MLKVLKKIFIDCLKTMEIISELSHNINDMLKYIPPKMAPKKSTTSTATLAWNMMTWKGKKQKQPGAFIFFIATDTSSVRLFYSIFASLSGHILKHLSLVHNILLFVHWSAVSYVC